MKFNKQRSCPLFSQKHFVQLLFYCGVLQFASTDVISENATATARILVTPTVLTDKVLTITQKGSGKFTVSVKTVESQDIKFDWFIVN